MTTLRSNQSGFGFLVVFLLVAVIAAVGVAGYRLTHGTDPSTLTSATFAPKTIKSKTDVQNATKALEATPIDEGVNPDQLDSDLNSLL